MSEALAKVNQAAQAVAANIQAAITFDDDGAGVLPETFVADNLALASGSEELSIETVKLVQTTSSNLAVGLALGLGNASLDLMSKNKNLDRTNAALEFGNDLIRASVDREMTVRVPGTNEEKKKYGNTSVKLESGAVAKRGELKRVLTHVSDNFAAAFAK